MKKKAFVNLTNCLLLCGIFFYFTTPLQGMSPSDHPKADNTEPESLSRVLDLPEEILLEIFDHVGFAEAKEKFTLISSRVRNMFLKWFFTMFNRNYPNQKKPSSAVLRLPEKDLGKEKEMLKEMLLDILPDQKTATVYIIYENKKHLLKSSSNALEFFRDNQFVSPSYHPTQTNQQSNDCDPRTGVKLMQCIVYGMLFGGVICFGLTILGLTFLCFEVIPPMVNVTTHQ